MKELFGRAKARPHGYSSKNLYIVGDARIEMEQAGRIGDSSRLFYLSRNPLHSSCAFQPLMKQYVGVFEKVSVYV